MRKLTALLLTAMTVLSVLVVPATSASAATVRTMVAIESPEAIWGLHYRITQIRETGDSDGAVLLAFWLAGASTDEILQALCIRNHETNPQWFGDGLGVVNSHGDSGPMQINYRSWHNRAESIGYPWDLVVNDPWFNALMSVHIWIVSGYSFSPWSTLKYCRNNASNVRYALAA